MDYDDQMTYALAILRKHPDVLAQFQTQYPHLCVDESQDTSRVQHAIIRLLAEKTGDLFLVGDEDQSIYGFRAAWPEALLQFPQTYPGAKLLFMEENYRSTPQILQAANAFIAKNRSRYPKTIRPVRPAGQPVQPSTPLRGRRRSGICSRWPRRFMSRRLPSSTATMTAPSRSSTRWSARVFPTAAAARRIRSSRTASSATCAISCALPPRRTIRSGFCASIINSAP